jgi:hypothetical protein
VRWASARGWPGGPECPSGLGEEEGLAGLAKWPAAQEGGGREEKRGWAKKKRSWATQQA